jgi:hypothetical protein
MFDELKDMVKTLAGYVIFLWLATIAIVLGMAPVVLAIWWFAK